MVTWRAIAGTAVVLGPLLGGCALLTPDETPSDAQSNSDEPSAEPSPTPTVTVTVGPPAPTPVALSDQAIGPVPFTSLTAYEDLLPALGQPTHPLDYFCLEFDSAEWDALHVTFNDDGTIYGWTLMAGPLSDAVLPPQGVYPGEPIERLLEQGAETRLDDPLHEYATDLDGYTWWSQDDSSDSPVTWVSVNHFLCAD